MTTIRDHLLYDEYGRQMPFKASPNLGGILQPEYLVVHYTAFAEAERAIERLTNPQSCVSAHLVIGRNGDVYQLAPFNRVAWHAGVSSWGEREGLNQFSIGIELDNAGKLTKHGSGWTDRHGAAYPKDEAIEAIHKSEEKPAGWHVFPEIQLKRLKEIAAALVAEYHLSGILGHEDIAPGRKLDPGPAFPMERFRRIIKCRTGSTGTAL